MAAPSNVQIPLALFKSLISFFEYLNISGYCFPVVFNYNAMLSELRAKQHRMNLHTAYTKAAVAKDGDQRRSAFASYSELKKRR